jgi:glycosyltransferase involved in cell wall biosynthesis
MRYGDDVGFVWNTIANVRDLAAGFLKDEFDCYIAYPRLSGKPVQCLENLSRLELDCYDMSEPNLVRIQAIISSKNVVVLMYMSALPASLRLPRLRAMGVRTVNTENDSFDHRHRDVFIKSAIKVVMRRWLKRQTHDVHIANARSQARYLLEYYKLPEARLRTIVNGVDCSRFRPVSMSDSQISPVLKSDKLWILCVGQARAEKRVEWAIRAAKRLRSEFYELPFCFALLGDGPALKGWQDMVLETGVGDDFKFLGAKSDTTPFYQSAALMAHAAERESFGLAIVEAMACSLPVVATAAAGPSETIDDGITGTLVDISDEEGFYQAIAAYLRNPDMRREHGSRGRERAIALYSITRQAREYAEVIRLCAGPSS